MARRLRSSSFFGDLSTREIHGLKVSKAFNICDFSSDPGGRGNGVLSVEHRGSFTLPLSLSFCKSTENSHLLAVSDEDGFVSIYDTRRHLPSFTSCREKTDQARITEWVAHNNAIFDLCWIKDGTQILTASGDQTVNVWNIETKKHLGTLVGHNGSVKSLCHHPSNPDILVSGSRDGSFAIWDFRCDSNLKSSISLNTNQHTPTAFVGHAHNPPKRSQRGKIAPVSITSVLFLMDDISIASAGAADSVVKLWDTRKLKSPFFEVKPQGEPQSDKETRKHGISSLSQDKSGAYIVASCMDNRLYLYNTLQINKGPAKVFSGSKIESFFVKSAINPEGTHILGGSSDGNAYIWRVDKPDQAARTLRGHEGEVTAVDWCGSEVGKFATCSDDFTVRVWNVTKRNEASMLSPTTVRKRITAPNLQARRLSFTSIVGPAIGALEEDNDAPCTTRKPQDEPCSPGESKSPELRTPESARKRSFLCQSEEGSPLSVLSPPPSLKRKTIRDYFASASKNETPSSPR
ncbi:transducin family protein / WD-40 repeat family protein [Rhynchospora pubera]|uniref:Transducin family protein / WD-40 repeat family protein n=1 Tax=Rhynchospora pubera TaxID=906938 RepID=A0AAV8D7Y7_9POAL|nr:transducin family protein / WD-40 repeat family protein [Rhynchospora pubera]